MHTELSLPTLALRQNRTAEAWLSDCLNQDTLRRTIGLTESESMWMLTHSPRSFPMYSFPSPTSTGFEVPLAFTRPITSSISSLTVKENEKLERRFALMGFSKRQSPDLAGADDHTFSSPSDKDFKRVLDRLEKITSSQGAAYGRVNLKEGKAFDLALDQGDRQTFRVQIRGCPCPLRVVLKRNGKTVIYASRTVMEPSEAIYDITTKAEKLVTSDPGLKFKSECLFFTVVAMEDLRFTVTIGFGREVQEGSKLTVRKRVIHKDDTLKAIDELKRDETKLNELYDRVELIQKQRRSMALSRSQAKDFVSLNKMVSPQNFALFSERMQSLAHRTVEAKVLRAQKIEAKKERALAMIYRREFLQEIAKKERLDAEAVRKRQMQERNIITTIFIGLSFEGINNLFLEGKKRAIEAQRKLAAAVRIQSALRRWWRRLDHVSLATLVARDTLRLWNCHSGALTLPIYETKVVSCVLDSQMRQKLPHVFKAFYRRSKSYLVNVIKAVWTIYRGRMEKRLSDLNALWTEVLEQLIKESTSKKSAAKKTRAGKKRDETLTYFNITQTAKDQVLTRHLMDCKQRFRGKAKEYIENTKLLMKEGPKAFMMRYLSMDDEEFMKVTSAPEFIYMLTRDEMTKLIDAAVALSPS